ncbi:MAG: tetratricopeptide repeat protein [Haliscomenobacter sp.]|nr:tetratricopeptide repeat protein [Haliscomenobacter sp.]
MKDWRDHGNVGFGLKVMGIGQSHRMLSKAIDIMPDFHVAFNNMGNAFYAKGEHDKAIECYQKAVGIKPDFHQAFINMGSAYDDLGDKDKAIECYQKPLASSRFSPGILHHGLSFLPKAIRTKPSNGIKKH